MDQTNLYHLQLIANRFEDGPDCPVAIPIRMAADEIARLRAELEAARVDAERYRIVRDKHLARYNGIRVIDVAGNGIYADRLDAAIDAARGKDND